MSRPQDVGVDKRDNRFYRLRHRSDRQRSPGTTPDEFYARQQIKDATPMVERKTSNLDATSEPVNHGAFHFTGHAVQRIAERFDVSIPTCVEWITAAKLAHKSDVETIEGIARREPHEKRSRLKLQWYVNREHGAAFLIGDETCSPRVVVTVLRFRDRSKKSIKNEIQSFQNNRPARLKRRGRLSQLRRHELEDAVA